MNNDPVVYNTRLKLTKLQGLEYVEVDDQPILAGDELVTTHEVSFFDDGEIRTHEILGSTVSPSPQPGVTLPAQPAMEEETDGN